MPAPLAQRALELSPPPWRALGRGMVAPLFGLALALGLHFLVARIISDFYAKVLVDVGINIVLAVSLNLVNGFTGQFSIGHAGFMAVGAYTAGALVYYGSFRLWGSAAFHGGMLSWTQDLARFSGPWFGAGDLLFLTACLAGGLAAAAVGYVVGLPSLRLRGDYLAIVTLGFGEIVRVLFQQSGTVLDDPAQIAQTAWLAPTWPPDGLVTHLGGALGFSGLPWYTSLFWVYLFVGLTVIAAYRLKMSSFGRAFLAIRENEFAAGAMGVAVTRYKVRAFVVAAFFAGIAGSLFAHEVGTTLNPKELAFQRSLEVVIMVVLGGMGSISGAILAAAVLTILPELLREFQAYRMVVYALLLIIMMIARPQGLLGLRELWEIGPWGRWLQRRREARDEAVGLVNPPSRMESVDR